MRWFKKTPSTSSTIYHIPIYLPYIYHISTIYLPYIYRISTIYLPYTIYLPLTSSRYHISTNIYHIRAAPQNSPTAWPILDSKKTRDFFAGELQQINGRYLDISLLQNICHKTTIPIYHIIPLIAKDQVTSQNQFLHVSAHLILTQKYHFMRLSAYYIGIVQWKFQDPKMEVLYHLSGHMN